MSTISASVLHGRKDLRTVCSNLISSPFAEYPLRSLQDSRNISPPTSSEVQVAIRATTICGSDLYYYHHFAIGDTPVREPLILGHESAGVVTALGSGVSGFAIGDKVALEVGVPCDACERCNEGRYNLCENMKFRGSARSLPHFQGTLQEKLNHPSMWIHR